ncbi:MAG: PLP-dependent transferase [Acidiferrobacteraceae bacterium]|mgnify:FL=1|nr:PLP-dependent transferase [Acidiferrobacteraceae bacterium]MBT3639597.1 PLP-dependent transferase [Acidiferrobacteraceae bacterium]MBT3769487.1 PLP-dependent transferase [Acidiferrobacteraceae bacterium]MBT3973728.1 PLP-dependent transferase [Acidiferrobacteraceae bacterium]MBT4396128.1 PLP-dependent transferase [Acidiferrobacteraceae bacterium]
MKFDTKVVRAGISPDPTTGSILPPIYETATYVLPEVGRDLGFDYTRSSNPTRQVLEDNLAAIENGKHAISFASGMSAVDACFKLFSAGDHIVCGDDVYGGVTRLLDNIIVQQGLSVSYVDTTNTDAVRAAITPATRMLWIETPTNPLLKVSDLEAMVSIARENNILLGVDSTFATPVFLRPLDFGADIVMHSTTKYLSGHNQIIGGVLITSDQRVYEKMKFIQKSIGAVSSPFDCWLNLSGLKTLHLRMKRHEESAMQVAQFLESHAKIDRVLYPGLPSHPQHAVAKAQMSGFSGMIAFELTGGTGAGKTLMNNVQLCGLAESLGSVETMITHPASMTHADVPVEDRRKRGLTDGLVRLSVGIEDVEDIIADLENALEKA